MQRVALELFARQGYEKTTVADIAAAAGVTQMTFFRHFAAKEGVILDDPYDPMIARRVAEQDAALPVLERVRLGVAAAWGDVSAVEDELARARLRIGAREPRLRARMRENNARTEAAIVTALTEQGVPRLPAAVATGAVIGALTAALLEWAQGEGVEPLGNHLLSALALLAGRDPAVLP